jgi:predicted nucleotidyltransferase
MSMADENAALLDALRMWAEREVREPFDRAYVFGSLVKHGGRAFSPAASDIDLLIQFGPLAAAPHERAVAVDRLRSDIDNLQNSLLAGCGRTPSAGVDLEFRGGFRLEVGWNCASGRLPVPQFLIEGTPRVTEHQVGQSKGLIRTRL